MKREAIKLFLLSLITTAAGLISNSVYAHGGSATMDFEGNSPSFTGLGRITCFDDGNGPAASLIARIRDSSAPVPGLLVNIQLLKGTSAISVTDSISGDAEYSDYIQLFGGQGTYYVILNKTAVGARDIDLEWHCLTADQDHTGTDIIGDQWE